MFRDGFAVRYSTGKHYVPDRFLGFLPLVFPSNYALAIRVRGIIQSGGRAGDKRKKRPLKPRRIKKKICNPSTVYNLKNKKNNSHGGCRNRRRRIARIWYSWRTCCILNNKTILSRASVKRSGLFLSISYRIRFTLCGTRRNYTHFLF